MARVLKRNGFNVFTSREFMSRVRGGSNSTEIRISSERVSSLVDRIDILFALNGGIRKNVHDRVTDSTFILGNRKELEDELDLIPDRFYDVDISELAVEAAGGKVYSNVAAAGILFGICGIDIDKVSVFLMDSFASKGAEIQEKNVAVAKSGIDVGTAIRTSGLIPFDIIPDSSVCGEIIMDGAEAVSMGAIAGGCNFIASYPMSPATGVLSFLAKHSETFGIVAEQAEDEISAINMAVGAAYAGARAMVTTSGGGFALMGEGLSLAGVMEMPVVVHLGQRPGPATGMATRTEQADLELALYSGHGEFPRIILAPATLDDGFWLTWKAFDLAEKFQTPVIILTDQYFLNTTYNTRPIDTGRIRNDRYLVESKTGYRRYLVTESGVSPQSVPSYGDGLVGVDSHEHDEWGHAQEDFDLRVRMVDKRLRKMEGIAKEPISPLFSGSDDFGKIVVSWGSTYPMVMEAAGFLETSDIAFMHLREVWPLSDHVKNLLLRAKEVIVIEGNATGQLGSLIRRETGIGVKHEILNYNGLQFSCEIILRELRKILG